MSMPIVFSEFQPIRLVRDEESNAKKDLPDLLGPMKVTAFFTLGVLKGSSLSTSQGISLSSKSFIN